MSGAGDTADSGVRERPSFPECAVDFGTFVIVSLDPVASVAALKDERATEQASTIPRGKYLAIVNSSNDDSNDLAWLVPPSDPPLALALWLVGQQPPAEPNSNAYIALFPSISQPNGRDPLIPEPGLPWPETFAHTLAQLSARVIRLHTNNPSPNRLTDKQVLQIMKVSSADTSAAISTRVEQLVAAPIPPDVGPTGLADTTSDAHGSSPLPRDNSVAGSHEANGRQAKNDVRRLGGGSSSSDTEDEDDSESSTSGSSGETNGKGVEAPVLRTHIEVWLDISTFTEFDDPSQLALQLARLREIENEWKVRATQEMLADQPRTREWVKGVAEAGGVAPEEPDSNAPNDTASPPPTDPLPETAPATTADHPKPVEPVNEPAKPRHLFIRLFGRVVDVPRRFIAKLIKIFPTRRKPTTDPPPTSA